MSTWSGKMSTDWLIVDTPPNDKFMDVKNSEVWKTIIDKVLENCVDLTKSAYLICIYFIFISNGGVWKAIIGITFFASRRLLGTNIYSRMAASNRVASRRLLY